MIFRWLRNRRRRRILARPSPVEWSGWLDELPFCSHLTDPERTELDRLTRVLVAEKNWEGCGGLELTEEMRVKIAAQASLLLLHLEHEYYRGVRSIFVYPAAYRAPAARQRDDGSVSAESVRLGEAWYRGPIVLAWDAAERGWTNARDGRNVVLHEFAHQLDYLDGTADGTPPLRSQPAHSSWREVMNRKYQGLVQAAEDDRITLLDKYGATNPAEFFAVCTECFFERGPQLSNRHPRLYESLRDYYHQDPAAWSSSA